MKGGFYGVYGINAVAVYDDWNKATVDKSKFMSHKVKKFLTKKKAVEYIEHGVTYVYGVIESGSFNKEVILASPLNTPISIEELTI